MANYRGAEVMEAHVTGVRSTEESVHLIQRQRKKVRLKSKTDKHSELRKEDMKK